MTDQMTPNITCETPPDTNDDLGAELDAVLAQLPVDKIRFVIARTECGTNKEAAAAVGLAEGTVKNWPKETKTLIEQALRLMGRDGVVTALHLRRRKLARAMAVKVAGLESDDEKVRQATATEIIEWELGKAKQASDLNLRGNVSVTHAMDAALTKVYGDGAGE